MKTYTEKEIKEILKKHGKWLRAEKDGERADLRSADLSYADLRYADLRSAYLRSAYLRSAYLSSADLRYADLRSAYLSSANLSYANLRYASLRYANLSYANLSSAYLSSADLLKTIFEGINWLAYLGIVPDSRGMARAYKVTTNEGEGIYKGGVNYISQKEFTAKLDKDVTEQCGAGINLATFVWCLNEKQEGRRLFMMSFKVSPDNICVPVGSDGKFRVARCRKVGECDWQGNLLTPPEGKE